MDNQTLMKTLRYDIQPMNNDFLGILLSLVQNILPFLMGSNPRLILLKLEVSMFRTLQYFE